MSNSTEPSYTSSKPSESADELFEKLFNEDEKTVASKNEDRCKNIQQQGFQISSETKENTQEALTIQINLLKTVAETKTKKWYDLYENFKTNVNEEIRFIDEEIRDIEEQAKEENPDLETLKNKRIAIQKELENLKQHLIQLKEKHAVSFKGIGEKLIADVELELIKIIALQKKLHAEVDPLNEEKHTKAKDALKTLVDKWKLLRETYAKRHELLNIKISLLGGAGINLRIAYLLVGLGYATAGVAGYFFAIFSTESNFSSKDIFYSLLQNIFLAIQETKIPLLYKFYFFIAILIIVTLLSWGIDFFINKLKSAEQGKNNPDQQAILLSSEWEIEGIAFSNKIQTNTWLLLWLRIMPFALIIGIILLILSKSSTAKSDTDKLSASTEGLIIGTALAMGLSGLVYLYVTKIIERRNQDLVSIKQTKLNWELVVVASGFILSMILFTFYCNNIVIFRYGPSAFSMIGFLITCFITAFVFAYGIRFLGLLESINEIEHRILYLDRFIAFRSFPEQLPLNINYDRSVNTVMDGLVDNIVRKRHLIKKNRTTLKLEERVKNLYNRLHNGVIDAFGNKAGENIYSSNLFEILAWEAEYYPEYAGQIMLLKGLFTEKEKELSLIEKEIKALSDERENASLLAKDDLKKLNQQKAHLQSLKIKVEKLRIRKETDIDDLLAKQIVWLKDGFAAGQWYRHQENNQ